MIRRFEENVPLSGYCTYRIGGKARLVVNVFDFEGLRRVLEIDGKKLVIGRGSKLLFSDNGYDGTVLVMRMERFWFLNGGDGLYSGLPKMYGNGLKFACDKSSDGFGSNILKHGGLRHDEVGVYAESGVFLPTLSRAACKKGLSGLEWAGGIPGTVGGALKMNAGAFGGDMSQVVVCADILREGRLVRLCAEDCGFGYRRSGFYKDDVIIGAVLKLDCSGHRDALGDSVPNESSLAKIELLCSDYAAKRVAAQPSGFSCGSIFKSVSRGKESIPAWRFIDMCGLRGIAVGGAQISPKHANFIVNNGGACAADVLALIRTARAEVFIKNRIVLDEEVICIGEF